MEGNSRQDPCDCSNSTEKLLLPVKTHCTDAVFRLIRKMGKSLTRLVTKMGHCNAAVALVVRLSRILVLLWLEILMMTLILAENC